MSERNKGIIALFFLAFLWAVIAVVPRYLHVSFTVFQQVYLRLFVAFLFSVAFFRKDLRFSVFKKVTTKDIGLLLLRSFSYYTLGVVLFTQALLLTKIGNVTFIDSIPMTAIMGFIFLKEKFSLKKGSLVALSFFGAFIISTHKGLELSSIGLGELIALASSFFIALAMISRKWQSKILNDKEMAAIMLLFGSIVIFIISLTRGEGLPIHNWGLTVLFFVLLGGILNTGISYFMNYGLSRVDAVMSGNIFALTPIFATILGFILFKEVPLVKELFGGALILSSVIAMHRLK